MFPHATAQCLLERKTSGVCDKVVFSRLVALQFFLHLSINTITLGSKVTK